MVSTGKVKPSPHAEDDPLASLKIESKQNKRRSRRSRSRGLIVRDVSGLTPTGSGRENSRLACGRATVSLGE